VGNASFRQHGSEPRVQLVDAHCRRRRRRLLPLDVIKITEGVKLVLTVVENIRGG
jgi:hypothetical protein